MHIFRISLLLISFTIPIHTKISIPKLPSKVSSFFSKTKEENSHYEFNNIKKLEISSSSGNVFVEPWKQPCVLVELRKKGSSQFLDSIKLQQKQVDTSLTVLIDQTDPKAKGSISVHILVPDTISLKVNSTKGSITIKKHNGPADVTTQHGNISIIDGTNTVLAKTVQGNITCQRKKMTPSQCLNLQADHGNVNLFVPQEFEADLEAHTTYGKIHSDLFISLHAQTLQLNEITFKEMKHHVHGWIGQPQDTQNPVTVLLCTDYGMINIAGYSAKSKTKQR